MGAAGGILFAMRIVSRYPALLALAIALCAASTAAPAYALTTSAPPPNIHDVAAVLIDADTGQVLYANHPNLSYPPASLTKMITLQVALNAVEAGKISLNQEIVPVKQAWAMSMPPRSSLMFLGPNQRLTVRTLLTGMIVDSGNDAAYEVAYLVAGSIPAFAKMMNEETKRMGFPQMHFVEPSGLSSKNRITAKEYAEFCRAFIRLHPKTLKWIFSVKKFAYPEPRNMTNGTHGKAIVQFNRNVLLWNYPGADGFKTGYIDQSGYNMAVTAVRHGMRLIAVVLGVHKRGRYDGEQLRAIYEERLLNYGFKNFTKIKATYKAPKPVRVWEGSQGSVTIAPYRRPIIVLPTNTAKKLKVTVEQRHNVLAPVRTGDTLGKLVFTVEGKQVKEIPLVAENTVSSGNLPQRVFDGLVLFARGVIGLPTAKAASPPPTSRSQAVAQVTSSS